MAKKGTTDKPPRKRAAKKDREKKEAPKAKAPRVAITFDTGANKYYWSGEKFDLVKNDFAARDQEQELQAAKAWLLQNNWVATIRPKVEEQ